MPRPERGARAGALVFAALLTLGGRADARVIQAGSCRLTVPDDWVVSGSHGQSPDAGIVADLDQVVDGDASSALEEALDALIIVDDPMRRVLSSTSESDGAVRFVALAPPKPQAACRARVQARDHAAVAARVARSLKRK